MKNNEEKKRKIYYISIFLIFNNEGSNLLSSVSDDNIIHSNSFDLIQKSPFSHYKDFEFIMNESYQKRKWLEIKRNENNLIKKSHFIINITSFIYFVLLSCNFFIFKEIAGIY